MRELVDLDITTPIGAQSVLPHLARPGSAGDVAFKRATVQRFIQESRQMHQRGVEARTKSFTLGPPPKPEEPDPHDDAHFQQQVKFLCELDDLMHDQAVNPLVSSA